MVKVPVGVLPIFLTLYVLLYSIWKEYTLFLPPVEQIFIPLVLFGGAFAVWTVKKYTVKRHHGNFYFFSSVLKFSDERRSPLEWSTLVNQLGLWWMNSLMIKGYKRAGALNVSILAA